MPRKHPPALLPDADLRALWRESATHLGVAPKTYVSRWLRFWNRKLDELIDQDTWEDRDIGVFAEYVEWIRKADFHARQANADPYNSNDAGRTFAHPGFKLEQEALVQSRIVGERLLIGYQFDEPENPDEDDAGDEDEDGPPANFPD